MDRPLVFIAVAFALGIVAGKIIMIPLWFSVLLFSIFFSTTIFAVFQKITPSRFILILCFLLGIIDLQVKELPSQNDVSVYADKGYLTVIGQINDAPRIKEGKAFFSLRVEKAIRGRLTSEANGTIYVALPEGKEPLNYGDKIKVRGIISPLQNYANPLMPEGRKAYRLNTYGFEKVESGGGSPLKKAAIWFSQKFNAVLVNILPQKEASLLGSVLLGSAVSPLPDELQENYRRAGLIHLLVVSGTQVSILIGVCLSLFRTLNLPLWVGIAVTSFFNLMLVVVTGGGASILRAAFMGEVTLLGLLFEKQKEFYTALAFSALILLIVDPANLFNIGFQLSFAATWALVYIAPVLEKKIPSFLAISLAPIMATSPIIAFYFSQISLGAILSNLLVLPWVEFLVILGFSTTILGFVFLPLAQVLGNTIWLMLLVLDWIAKMVANLPGAYFFIKAPTLPIIIGYYLGMLAFIEILRKEEKVKLTTKHLGIAFLFVVSIFLWNGVASPAVYGGKELTVTFMDVGQGDAALIETAEGKKILIDGGGTEPRGKVETSDKIGEKVVVPFLHRKGISKLDLVVLTHPHADHLGGLNSVLKGIKVDQVLDSGQDYPSVAYKRFKALVAANKIKYSIARAGQAINFDNNLRVDILNPIFPLLGDTNSDSIVMRLVYDKISFLFTGDMEKEGEERVERDLFNRLPSTILKAGHHGSATSTSDDFLRAVNPEVAVISVGTHNRYRHPSQGTLRKIIEEARAKLYRTDKNGAVTIRTNGQTFTVETQK